MNAEPNTSLPSAPEQHASICALDSRKQSCSYDSATVTANTMDSTDEDEDKLIHEMPSQDAARPHNEKSPMRLSRRPVRCPGAPSPEVDGWWHCLIPPIAKYVLHG
jgi:hypothetical protein